MIDQIRATARSERAIASRAGKVVQLKICFRAAVILSVLFFGSLQLSGNFEASAQTMPATQLLLSDSIVADPVSGLALFGYDPVAYFIDDRAVIGNAEYELRVSGLIWRFRNSGNRTEFEANPDAYIPQFGGYDGLAVTKGKLSASNPALYTVLDGKLYLFRNAASKQAFLTDLALRSEAMTQWLNVKRELIKPRQ